MVIRGTTIEIPSNLITTSGVSMGKYAFYACLMFCKWGDGSCFSDPDRSHLIFMTTTNSPIVLEGTPLPFRHLSATRLGVVGSRSLVHKMQAGSMDCRDTCKLVCKYYFVGTSVILYIVCFVICIVVIAGITDQTNSIYF
jgi:hypothetical protein